MTPYARILRAVTEHPWAMMPERLEALLAVVELRCSGHALTDEEIRARIGAGQSRPPIQAPASIAVIPVFGVIAHRMNAMTAMSGGTSTELLGKAVRRAAADPSIGAILLDVDSGGGNVLGVQEAGDVIHEARQAKRIVAVANTTAGSAAYWLASQADELVVTPSGQVGAVGVYTVHEDRTGMAEQAGVKVTYISAGARKVEAHPFTVLDEEARAYLQARVDGYYEAFVAAVARGRGVAKKAVREGFGEGRAVGAAEALALNMVDRVEPFEATLERLARRVGGGRGTMALSKRAIFSQHSARVRAETVEPDEEGRCPEGYEKHEDDGLCHPMTEEAKAAAADLDYRRRRHRALELG